MKNSINAINERRKTILYLLETYGNLSVSEIAGNFDVSEATIRRDLAFLESRHELTRMSGKVMVKNNYHTSIKMDRAGFVAHSVEEVNSLTNSLMISRATAELIEDGDTVFLNSSRTALDIFRFLGNKRVLFVTNNLLVPFEKFGDNINFVVLGGEVKHYGPNKMSTFGDMTNAGISSITASKCILGVSGISAAGGVTSTYMHDIAINREMISHCSGKKIVIGHSYKIGRKYNYYNFSAKVITDVISDKKANEICVSELREMGITVNLV